MCHQSAEEIEKIKTKTNNNLFAMKHSRRKAVWKTYYVIIDSKRILSKEGGVHTDLFMYE